MKRLRRSELMVGLMAPSSVKNTHICILNCWSCVALAYFRDQWTSVFLWAFSAIFIYLFTYLIILLPNFSEEEEEAGVQPLCILNKLYFSPSFKKMFSLFYFFSFTLLFYSFVIPALTPAIKHKVTDHKTSCIFAYIVMVCVQQAGTEDPSAGLKMAKLNSELSFIWWTPKRTEN